MAGFCFRRDSNNFVPLPPRACSVTRACHKDFIKSTRLRCAAVLHRLCVSVPAASIGLGRVMPELLLLHLEADGACRRRLTQTNASLLILDILATAVDLMCTCRIARAGACVLPHIFFSSFFSQNTLHPYGKKFRQPASLPPNAPTRNCLSPFLRVPPPCPQATPPLPRPARP